MGVVIGMVIGTFIGGLIVCCCVVAGRKEESYDVDNNTDKKGRD